MIECGVIEHVTNSVPAPLRGLGQTSPPLAYDILQNVVTAALQILVGIAADYLRKENIRS